MDTHYGSFVKCMYIYTVYNYACFSPSPTFKFCLLLLSLLIYPQWTWAGLLLKLWLYWSIRSTRTWRGSRTSTAATTCCCPTSTTASACQPPNLQYPRQVSYQSELCSLYLRRCKCAFYWTTDRHLIGGNGCWLATVMWPFYSSISMSSWHTVLRDAYAVRHLIESNSPPKQPPPVPLKEYQQLQPGPG